MSDLDEITERDRTRYQWGRAEGVAVERAAIVAWLRSRKHPYAHQLADAIEHVAHLRGNDE